MNRLLSILILYSTICSAEDIKFNALAFYEYSYNSSVEGKNSNEFELHRVYFTFEKEMSNTLSYKFQTDVGRNSADGRLEVYLKNAKIDWTTAHGKFVIGLQGMNLFNVQEKTWGYRSVEKSAMDKYKFASSADMGLGFYNSFVNVNYSVLVTNGAGYKSSENDSFKKLSAQILYGPSILNSKQGWNIGGVFSFEPYTKKEYTLLEGIFCGFSSGQIRAGIEFDQLLDSDSDETIKIISGNGNLKLNDKFNIFGRVDNFTNSDYTANYFIAGISVMPEKGLKIIPNFRYTTNSESENILKYNLNFEFKI
ncbi:MAG: hypothetical protein V3R52_04050 [Candidatus Neomarinimicrobiota bacterium]